MRVNKILHLMSPNWRQNLNFIKIYSKKRQFCIFLDNINNSENDKIFESFSSYFKGKSS